MYKVLIPLDGSDTALQAIHHVLHWVAGGLKLRVVVANVQSPANLYELVVAHDPQVLRQVSDAAGRDLLRAGVQLLQAAGVQLEQAVVQGDPAQALLELAEIHACDAVVLTAHGSSGLLERVFGSVSQALLQHARIPVMVVRVDEVSS